MNKKTAVIIVVLFLCQVFFTAFIYKYYKQKNIISNSLISQVSQLKSSAQLFSYPDLGIDGIWATYDFNAELDDFTTTIDIIHSGKSFHKEYLGGLYNTIFFNGVEFPQPILVIIRGEGQSINTSMLAFNIYDKSIHEVQFIDKDKTISDELCCSYALFIPKKDGIKYDVGMPDFSYKIPKIQKYEYDKEKFAFIEK